MFGSNEEEKIVNEKVYEDFETASKERNKYLCISLGKGGCGIADIYSNFVKVNNGKIIVNTELIQKVFSIENGVLKNPSINLRMVIRPYKLLSFAINDGYNEEFVRVKLRKEYDIGFTEEVFGFLETDNCTYLVSLDPIYKNISVFSFYDCNNSHKAMSKLMAKYFINPYLSNSDMNIHRNGEMSNE